MDEYIDKAIEFIHYNYATIQVTDVVNFIGFTRSYFSTVFKKRTGLSPQDYLIQVRLTHAKKMLEDTDYLIQDIAEQCGYDDALTFSKAFRQLFGVSPRGYRKREPSE